MHMGQKYPKFVGSTRHIGISSYEENPLPLDESQYCNMSRLLESHHCIDIMNTGRERTQANLLRICNQTRSIFSPRFWDICVFICIYQHIKWTWKQQEVHVYNIKKKFLYCKRGYFRWGKISRKFCQHLSHGGNFHDISPISLIEHFGFYFPAGEIFAKKAISRKSRKLPPRENFHVYSTWIGNLLFPFNTNGNIHAY